MPPIGGPYIAAGDKTIEMNIMTNNPGRGKTYVGRLIGEEDKVFETCMVACTLLVEQK